MAILDPGHLACLTKVLAYSPRQKISDFKDIPHLFPQKHFPQHYQFSSVQSLSCV